MVTASDDCPDLWGYCDYAIGWFPHDRDIVSAGKVVIREHWEWHKREGRDEGWGYLFTEGLVNDEEACALSREVWPEDVEEEDDDELLDLDEA